MTSSNEALAKHSQHVAELKKMIKDQADGPAKQELQDVLKNAEKHVTDLESHIKKGQELIEKKDL